MAYIDQENSKEHESDSTSKPITTNQSLYKTMKNKQPKKDYSDLLKIVVTGVMVILYIRPIARISSELAIYEFVILILFGATGGFMARSKDNELNGFLLSVLFGPLGLIMSIYLDDRTRIACGFCAENIKKEAAICPFCKSDLNN